MDRDTASFGALLNFWDLFESVCQKRLLLTPAHDAHSTLVRFCHFNMHSHIAMILPQQCRDDLGSADSKNEFVKQRMEVVLRLSAMRPLTATLQLESQRV